MTQEQRIRILENKVKNLEMAVRALSSQKGIDLSKLQSMNQQPVTQQVNIQKPVVQTTPTFVTEQKPIVQEHKEIVTQNNVVNEAVVEQKPKIDSKGLAEESKQQQAEPQQNIQRNVQKQQIQRKVQVQKQNKLQERNDTEAFLGKKVFVILASVLAFIGVVLFAAAIVPYLTATIKFLLMCIVSLVFTGFSYCYVKKKETSLSIGLLACGLGTIYITLFTGNLYFKVIPLILLYIALMLWLLVAFYCSRYKPILFNIIGQLGILISLILCTGDALLKQNGSYILYAIIYVIVAELLYDVLFKKEGYLINTISMLLSIVIISYPIIYEISESYENSFLPFNIDKLTLSTMFSTLDGRLISFLLLCGLFGYAVIKNIIMAKQEKITIVNYTIINYTSLFVFFVSMGRFEFNTNLGIVMMLYCIINYAIIEWVFNTDSNDINLLIQKGFYVFIEVVLYMSVFSGKNKPLTDLFNTYNDKLVVFILFSAFMGFIFIKNLLDAKKKDISIEQYSIVNFIDLFIYVLAVSQFEFTTVLGCIMLIHCLVVFGLTEWIYFNEEREVFINVLDGILVASTIVLYYITCDTLWISGLILVIPLMLYIYKTNTKCNKWVYIVGLGIATLANLIYAFEGKASDFVASNLDLEPVTEYYDNSFEYAVIQGHNVCYYLSCIIFAVFCYILVKNRKKIESTVVDPLLKVIMYVFVLSNILLTFVGMSTYKEYKYDMQLFENVPAVRLLLIMLICLVIQFIFRFNNFFEKKEEIFTQGTFITYFVVNAFMLLYSIYFLYEIDDYKFVYFIGVVITIILFTMTNSLLLLKKNSLLSIYLGIKMTVLIFVITHVFESQPIISIFLFLWAVACIIIGLKTSQKYLRIFALVLAMISSAKLILFDISYSNLLTRAISLFVCAGLCFFISWIYHRIEMTNKDIMEIEGGEEDEEEQDEEAD